MWCVIDTDDVLHRKSTNKFDGYIVSSMQGPNLERLTNIINCTQSCFNDIMISSRAFFADKDRYTTCVCSRMTADYVGFSKSAFLVNLYYILKLPSDTSLDMSLHAFIFFFIGSPAQITHSLYPATATPYQHRTDETKLEEPYEVEPK